MAIHPDPYFALPSLRGAPAYSRPPRPAGVAERPLNADDLPLATYQTEEERRLANALLAPRGLDPVGAGMGHEPPGGGHPGYYASGNGQHDRASEMLPRGMSLRGLTDRLRTRG